MWVWYFYCYLLTYFTPFPSVSITDFEQVNVSLIKADSNGASFFSLEYKYESCSPIFIFVYFL